ncbi:Lrp/AsnC family transcriptional regulator [Desulfovibrio inopinatus]|uniref:siroheme decarboxylase subunit beta n=1 Tax=Desulfovibrio inopinatus TaxID=102109 RepID=UPI0003FD0235|nr:Lrp/AsnC family transcriptional regulator [Desulfovibrio inopinatus]
MAANDVFTETEARILSLVQGNLPDSATPFQDIANEVGVNEEDVLTLLQKLKDDGRIRRFGATLRHQKAGYGANAMVAWYVDEDKDIDKIGEHMASKKQISHCYHRRNCLDWPYNIYTMIHGKSPEECLQVVEELKQETGLTEYDVLYSVKELKKTSMSYFQA